MSNLKPLQMFTLVHRVHWTVAKHRLNQVTDSLSLPLSLSISSREDVKLALPPAAGGHQFPMVW